MAAADATGRISASMAVIDAIYAAAGDQVPARSGLPRRDRDT